jgi:uncharacterized protein
MRSCIIKPNLKSPTKSESTPLNPRFPIRARLYVSLTFFVAAGCNGAPILTIAEGPVYDAAFLTHITDSLILPTYQKFNNESQMLVSSYLAYLDALQAGADTEALLMELREAWKRTMRQWQEAELLQVGPSAQASKVGGGGFRDEIYSWPIVNACRVDQETVAEAFRDDSFFTDQVVNVYGLDALEYLLFSDDNASNACPEQSSINSEGLWDDLNTTQKQLLRGEYGLAAGQYLHERAVELYNQWSEEGEDFRAAFTQAGQAQSPYLTIQEAVQDLSHALFYLESTVKDYKLARPAGLLGCVESSCPQHIESPYALISKENIIANLEMGRKIFLGGESAADGLGFDDYLLMMEPAGTSLESMELSLNNAISQAKALEGTVYSHVSTLDPQACAAGEAPLCALYESLKEFTDQLKTRFVELLALEIPQQAAGDAD